MNLRPQTHEGQVALLLVSDRRSIVGCWRLWCFSAGRAILSVHMWSHLNVRITALNLFVSPFWISASILKPADQCCPCRQSQDWAGDSCVGPQRSAIQSCYTVFWLQIVSLSIPINVAVQRGSSPDAVRGPWGPWLLRCNGHKVTGLGVRRTLHHLDLCSLLTRSTADPYWLLYAGSFASRQPWTLPGFSAKQARFTVLYLRLTQLNSCFKA